MLNNSPLEVPAFNIAGRWLSLFLRVCTRMIRRFRSGSMLIHARRAVSINQSRTKSSQYQRKSSQRGQSGVVPERV
jgi:hypothetical protein